MYFSDDGIVAGVVASLEKRDGVCWFGFGAARWQCGRGSVAKAAAGDLKMSVKQLIRGERRETGWFSGSGLQC